jgi:putative hydroxymethylpyrimidine transporter CytX
VLGHLVGTALLVLGGVIGFRERVPAIRSTRISFGRQGSWLISLINVLQLIGWTAVMIVEGGRAINAIAAAQWGFDHQGAACVAVGGCIALWVFLGLRGFKVVNVVAVLFLLALTVVLSVVLAGKGIPAGAATGDFGMGFELSIIMPLSWFPLIGDYTSMATSRRGAWLAPFLGYFTGSCWMYSIGLAGALESGSADPSSMMLAAGLGLVALCIIGLSTVTTTFLDAWSAAESSINVFARLPRRGAAVFFAALGTLLALYFPVERYTDFLYVLGSVFAPLIAILLADYFLFGTDRRERAWDLGATLSLAVGVIVYYSVKDAGLPTGPTLATIAASLAVHAVVRKVVRL